MPPTAVRVPKVQVVRSGALLNPDSDCWLEYDRPASANTPNLVPSAYCPPTDPAADHDDSVESAMFGGFSIEVVACE